MIEKNDLEFTHVWANKLLDKLGETGEGKRYATAEEAIEACSEYCFQQKNMVELFKNVSTLEELIEIFRKKWNWIVEYDEENGVLICNENKDYCLCPVVRFGKDNISKNICCCTIGMIKRIFQETLHNTVRSELLRSVVRDGKSCIYKITLI